MTALVILCIIAFLGIVAVLAIVFLIMNLSPGDHHTPTIRENIGDTFPFYEFVYCCAACGKAPPHMAAYRYYLGKYEEKTGYTVDEFERIDGTYTFYEYNAMGVTHIYVCQDCLRRQLRSKLVSLKDELRDLQPPRLVNTISNAFITMFEMAEMGGIWFIISFMLFLPLWLLLLPLLIPLLPVILLFIHVSNFFEFKNKKKQLVEAIKTLNSALKQPALPLKNYLVYREGIGLSKEAPFARHQKQIQGASTRHHESEPYTFR